VGFRMSRAFVAGWRVIKGENPLPGRGRQGLTEGLSGARQTRSQPLQPATTDPTVRSMKRRGGRALRRRAEGGYTEPISRPEAERDAWDPDRLLDDDYLEASDSGFGPGRGSAKRYFDQQPIERTPRPGSGPRSDFESTGADAEMDEGATSLMGDPRQIPMWLEPKEQGRMIDSQNREGGFTTRPSLVRPGANAETYTRGRR
jgi:hypothetical protein